MKPNELFDAAVILSPRCNSAPAKTVKELATEQLTHFNIEVDRPLGEALLATVERVH